MFRAMPVRRSRSHAMSSVLLPLMPMLLGAMVAGVFVAAAH
jgi:flagellar biosynthesis protein FliQ